VSTITDIPPDLDKKDDTDAILALVFGAVGVGVALDPNALLPALALALAAL